MRMCQNVSDCPGFVSILQKSISSPVQDSDMPALKPLKHKLMIISKMVYEAFHKHV